MLTVTLAGYVENMRTLLFTLSQESLNKTLSEYKAKVPKPLNAQFPDRKSKAEAVEHYTHRKGMIVTLQPAGK